MTETQTEYVAAVATSEHTSPRTSRTISGRVSLVEGGRGVPGLVVEAIDVDVEGGDRRLGSAITDASGSFRMDVEPAYRGWRRRRHARPWNLVLRVLAPESPHRSRPQRLLFCSEPRPRAMNDEHFLMTLPTAALEAVGIRVTDDATATAEAGTVMTSAFARTEAIEKVAGGIFEKRLDRVEARRGLFRAKIRETLVPELDLVSDDERTSDDRFVSAEKEIPGRQRVAIKRDVDSLAEVVPDPVSGQPIGRIRRAERMVLTSAQKTALVGTSTTPVTLTESEVEEALGASLDKPPALFRRTLATDPCRPRTRAEDCLDGKRAHDEDREDDGRGESDGDGTPPVDGLDRNRGNDRRGRGVLFSNGTASFDADGALDTVMGRLSGPEDPVEFGARTAALEAPLTIDRLTRSIQDLTFAPGPADVPAFYDFHDLQIAWRPLWSAALDDRFLDDVEAAYDQFVERGGKPAVGRFEALVNAGPFGIDRFLDVLADVGSGGDDMYEEVASAVLITREEWHALPSGAKEYLSELATAIRSERRALIDTFADDKLDDIDFGAFANLFEAAQAARMTKESIAIRTRLQLLTSDAEGIVALARRLLLEAESKGPFRPTHAIIEQLRRRHRVAYPFRHFAASTTHRSINFGVIVTYQQVWTPQSYQVGELVKTIPLGPKSSLKYSRTVKKTSKRSIKEEQSAFERRTGETSETSRVESEIIRRATAKTDYKLTSQGSVQMGGGGGGSGAQDQGQPKGGSIGVSASSSQSFARNVEKHSQAVKKEFNEAVRKASEEVKNERRTEVVTDDTFEEELTETSEIQNPNDEIPCTFLFYELQRRFKVEERIHGLQAVVLVAQEVPKPSAIDNAWLIRHDWILSRVLLDPSFSPALSYVSTSLIADEISLKEMRDGLFRQRKLVEELKEDLADRRTLAGLRYGALQRQVERTAESAEKSGGIFGSILGGVGDVLGGVPVVGGLIGGGMDLLTGGQEVSQADELREAAARDAFDRERREEQDLASRLAGALSTLEHMQREYTSRLSSHLAQLGQVERLIDHIWANILYYMQAIWAYEPDDQRFLRLRNVPIPIFEKDKGLKRYTIKPQSLEAHIDLASFDHANTLEADADLGIKPLPPDPDDIETRPLSEVADLYRPLGFMGNYMILPLIESNPITEFMMEPYVTLAEGEYGVTDPDPLGNMTLDEFSDYVCCLRAHFEEESTGGDDVAVPDVTFDSMKPRLREALKRLLERAGPGGREIVVPSEGLYIEALPGTHSVMERFKHLHRQIDVKKVQAEVREQELENIRRAERIKSGDLADPEIEAKYLFEGDGNATVVAPSPGGGP